MALTTALTMALTTTAALAAPAATAATTISIESDVRPELVYFRDGVAGAWQPASRTGDTSYRATVHGPYTLMVVCLDDYEVPSTLLESRTPEDDRLFRLACSYGAPGQVTHRVTGTMKQPGSLAFADWLLEALIGNGSWDFALDVPSGLYDLMAADGDRVLVQRDIEVTHDLQLPGPIDLANGQPFHRVPVTVTNATPDERLSSTTFFSSSGLGIFLHANALPAHVIPSELLRPTDLQSVRIAARSFRADGFSSRSVRRVLPQGSVAPLAVPFTFLSPLYGFTTSFDANGDVKSSWTELKSVDDIAVSAYDFDAHYLTHRATRAYLEATGARSLTLDTQVPGYRPAWRIDPQVHDRSVITSVYDLARAERHFYQDALYFQAASATAHPPAAQRAALRTKMDQRLYQPAPGRVD